jgi:hypothetical protein
MGLGSSKFSLLPSSKITNKEDFKLKTADMTGMANALFDFMYKSSTPDHEAFDIAEKPEKYVIALSELIEKQFNVLGYTTTRTVGGEMYFQSYAKLDPSKYTGELKEQHKKNCKVIAFFFVRIYQILGSMLLVIKDNGFDTSTSLTQNPYSDREFIGARLPKVYYTQRGGAIADTIFLGPLEFLRSSLVEASPEEVEYIDSIPIDSLSAKRGSEKPVIYKISETDLFVSYRPYQPGVTIEMINKNPPRFYILTKEPNTNNIKPFSYEIYILNMYDSVLNNNKSLKSILFRTKAKGNSQQEYTTKNNEKNKFGVRKSESDTSDRYTRFIMDTSSKKGDDLLIAETAAIQYYPFKFSERSSVKFFLNFYFLQNAIYENGRALITKTDRNQIRGDDEDHATGEGSSNQGRMKKSDINNPVIKTIYGELLKGTADYNKTLPSDRQSMPSGKHCIKRAIQLLNPEAIYSEPGSTEANYTRVCKFSAPDSKDKQVAFDHYVPTKTFAQLYGKISVNPEEFKKSQQVLEALISTGDHTATQGTVSVQQVIDAEDGRTVKTETDDLKDALVRLKAAFKLLNEPADPAADTKVPKGFNEILMKTPKECDTIQAKAAAVPDGKGVKDGGIVIQNDNIVRQLRDISQELLADHVNSTIEITKFLQTIFNIDKDPSGNWRVRGIKDNLLISGFPALDKITDIARELLLNYYEGCEKKYQKGVKLWLDENKDTTPAAVPGAAAAPAPAAAPGAAASAGAKPIAP